MTSLLLVCSPNPTTNFETTNPNFHRVLTNYRVANKFSDTLNELFVVNCLISKFFCENTRWKLVSSSHYLKLLIKSTMHGLSYSLKCDLRSISKFTFVSPFDTEPWEFFSQKNAISYSNHHYLDKKRDYLSYCSYSGKHIFDLNNKQLFIFFQRLEPKGLTNILLEIDLRPLLRL